MMRFLMLAAAILCVSSQAAEAKKKIVAHHKAHTAKAAPKVNSPIAKEIFARQTKPSPMKARVIGSYAKGCLAGGEPLPTTGPTWQAMRLSRNRNWGYPALLNYLTRFADDTHKLDGWAGLLVGDMSQPMGGPMMGGHASHQAGLDVDVWLKPMPSRTLTKEERETEAPVSMLASTGVTVDPAIWTPNHVKLIKRAASYPQVTRIFVHPAIKKALCDGAGDDRAWLSKVQPYWGHHYHFHVRLRCPAGMASCENQPARPVGDGCGKEVEDWLKMIKKPPAPEPVTPPVQKHPLTLADLPAECSKLAGLDLKALAAAVPMGPAAVPLPERKPSSTAEAAKPVRVTAAAIPVSVKVKPASARRAKAVRAKASQ